MWLAELKLAFTKVDAAIELAKKGSREIQSSHNKQDRKTVPKMSTNIPKLLMPTISLVITKMHLQEIQHPLELAISAVGSTINQYII